MIRQRWPFVLGALVVVLLYAPMLGHPFLWDDGVQVSSNPAVTDGVPIVRYFCDRNTTSSRAEYNTRIYRPLRNAALHVVWKISSATPAHRTVWFHGFNLLLYVLGGWLVLLIVARSCGDERMAAIAAGVWLLLPVHAEDVLYASAFGDELSMVLQLGGLLLVMQAFDEEGYGRIVASLACFAGAVFTKEMAVTSAALVPAYLWCERRASLKTRRAWITIALYGLVAMAYLVVRTKVLGRIGQGDLDGGHGLWRALTHLPWLTLLNAKAALQPLGHAPDYGPDDSTTLSVVICAVAFIAIAVLAWWRAQRGLAYGALFFVLALLPVLQLVPVWTLLADRFLLVPSVGIAIVLGALLVQAQRARKTALIACAAFAFVSAGGTAIERARFADDMTFWRWAVANVPTSSMAEHNLGFLILRGGDPKGALPHLLHSYDLGRRHARLFVNLASAFEALGRDDDALIAAREGVRRDAEGDLGWLQLSSVLRRRGDLAGAEDALDHATQTGGTSAAYLRQRGALRLKQGRLDEAREDLSRAVELEATSVARTPDPAADR